MKRIIIAMVLCALLTSCGGVVHGRVPAQTIQIQIGGQHADSYSLQTALEAPASVKLERVKDTLYQLQLPQTDFGGIAVMFITFASHPENEWKVQIMRGEQVIRTLSVARVKKLKEINGIRLLVVEK